MEDEKRFIKVEKDDSFAIGNDQDSTDANILSILKKIFPADYPPEAIQWFSFLLNQIALIDYTLYNDGDAKAINRLLIGVHDFLRDKYGISAERCKSKKCEDCLVKIGHEKTMTMYKMFMVAIHGGGMEKQMIEMLKQRQKDQSHG